MSKPIGTVTVSDSIIERNELKKLSREIEEIKKNDFPGRMYTNDTNEKIKRFEHLKKKYNKPQPIGINPMP